MNNLARFRMTLTFYLSSLDAATRMVYWRTVKKQAVSVIPPEVCFPEVFLENVQVKQGLQLSLIQN